MLNAKVVIHGGLLPTANSVLRKPHRRAKRLWWMDGMRALLLSAMTCQRVGKNSAASLFCEDVKSHLRLALPVGDAPKFVLITGLGASLFYQTEKRP